MLDTDGWRTELSGARIAAYYQPIVSSDTGLVYGHEALGRYIAEGTVEARSLGPFFAADSRSLAGKDAREEFLEFRKGLDRSVRTEALRRAAAGSGRIFVNITPSLMLGHLRRQGDQLPHSVLAAREAGLSPNRVVLEITEENVDVEPLALMKLIDVYRAEGFNIALDDVGSAGSNLDRVGLFQPDIIKIDYRLLERSSESLAFRHILDALARLAEKLGSDLLFEGVETGDDLQNALSYGARYLQGYLFSPAVPDFAGADAFAPYLNAQMSVYYRNRLERARRNLGTEAGLIAAARSLGLERAVLPGCGDAAGECGSLDPALVASLLREAGSGAAGLARVYATDLDGRQSSPNYLVEGGGVRADPEARGKSWCWRPYFFDHIAKSGNACGVWTVSAPYRDIVLKVPVRTLAVTGSEGFILFLDFLAPGTD